jgi:serine/threonine protein kinase HipA of HipAB toxin-antitoxin module
MLGAIRVDEEDPDKGSDPKDQFQREFADEVADSFHLNLKVRKECHKEKSGFLT